MFIRIWQSATAMTWLNLSARVISLTAVLPLVLRRFPASDIALYYLFASIVALQLMVGSGFVPTFARFVSFALAGASEADFEAAGVRPIANTVNSRPDVRTFSHLIGTLHVVFTWTALGTLPIVGAIGTWLLLKPISASTNASHAWMAWGVVAVVTPLTLYANQFSALLQGANQIAMEQRWSAVFVIAGSLLGLVALVCGGGLFSLVLASQLSQIASFIRLWWLARRTLRTLPYDPQMSRYSPALFRAVWPGSWRSFVGVAASTGVTNLTGLVFAQRLAAAPLAEFLFGLRIMSIASEVSRAPFYSRIPVLNSLRARGEVAALVSAARRGMRLSYATFIAVVFAVPLVAAVALPLIHSHIAFPRLVFWLTLGAATLVERWGAMHIQVYSTTHHIIWHWLNGATGLVLIGLMAVLVPYLGSFAYPVGMLVAYSLIYVVVSVRRSLRSLAATLWAFERGVFLPAACAWTCSALVLLVIHWRAPTFLR